MMKENSCKHLYYLYGTSEKTLEGFYKDPEDYKPGEMYNLYFCLKCSKIEIIDYNIEDLSPVLEFEKNNKIIKSSKNYKELKQEYESKIKRRK